jgi:phosphatidate cytidylyltransferase
MTTPETPEAPVPDPGPAPAAKTSRAGRDLPAAITSGVLLVAMIIASLIFWKTAFLVVVAVAVVVALWELDLGFKSKGINLPQEPLMLGGGPLPSSQPLP